MSAEPRSHAHEAGGDLDQAGQQQDRTQRRHAMLLHEAEDDHRQPRRRAGDLQGRAGQRADDDAADDARDQSHSRRHARGQRNAKAKRHRHQKHHQRRGKVAGKVTGN